MLPEFLLVPIQWFAGAPGLREPTETGGRRHRVARIGRFVCKSFLLI